MIKYLPVLLLLIFCSSTAIAQMYKWVDKEGNISYSDQPPFKGAAKLDVPELTTMPATDVPKKKPVSAKEKEKEKNNTKYTFLKITSPENDAFIRSIEGNFSISFTTKPSLNTEQGHYFTVSMDGKIVKDKLSASSANFSNIDRGTHKLRVSIKSKSGKTLRKSKTITMHMHRQTIVRKPALQAN